MITWEADLTMLQLSDNVVSIKATRTDDTPIPPDIWSYVVENVNVAINGLTLAQIRDKIVNTIWGAYQDHLAKNTVIQQKKSNYESAIISELQAKEVL